MNYNDFLLSKKHLIGDFGFDYSFMPNISFDFQKYIIEQAIRRFWRFGQKRDVTIDMVISDGQTRVLQAIQQKTEKAIELYENLTKNANSTFENKIKEFNKEVIKPNFL